MSLYKLVCFSKEESTKWIKSHGYSDDILEEFTHRVVVRIPLDSNRRCAIVKHILSWLPADGTCLLWITSWGIWASGENAELLYQLRAAHGETRQLHEAPGQEMHMEDRVTLECLLDVCIYNLWDATLADAHHRFIIQFSHDEYFQIACTPVLFEKAVCTRDIYPSRDNSQAI